VAAWLATAAAAAAADQGLRVSIEGDVDESGHQYRWTVTNRHQSPIVYLEFPHYHADLFQHPEGWTAHNTEIVGISGGRKPGICSAQADSSAGIQPGESAVFSMRIAPAGAKRGIGQVQIRFADGGKATVAGVELPREETFSERYTLMLGFAGLFVLYVVIRARRVRTRRDTKEQSAP
jgi:hypothetical protein